MANRAEYALTAPRHCNGLLVISKHSNDALFKKDASWFLRKGLNCRDNWVSFESVNYPGHYLRHENYRIKKSKYKNTDLFKKDASWKINDPFVY